MSEKMMKAAVLHAVNDLRYENVPRPVPKDGEVLLRVMAAGVCGSDIPRIFTKGTYHFPTIPGHEFAGRIVESDDPSLLGRKAAVFPLLPCRKCAACQVGEYVKCADYDYYGSRRDGGMAEYLAVKRFNILPLPDSVSLAAGAMCEPSAVALHAIRKLGDLEGKSLLISGAGPIGMLAAMWARSRGARVVYFFDLDARKIEAAKKEGFYEYEDGISVDAVIEGTGASAALARCLGALKPFGEIVLMGNPSRGIELTQAEYWLILRKELRLYGTWNSSFGETQNDWRDAICGMSDGTIRPESLITHRFGMEAYREAFALMRERKEFFQKVMLEVEQNDGK